MTNAGKLFADMYKESLTEASTTGDIIKSKPGGSAIMKDLHTTEQTPHDLRYDKIEKISWSELKDYSRKSWVVIVGSEGTGAIKVDNNTYLAKAAKADGEVKSFRNDRGGNILDFLKGNIGKLREFHVALKQKDTSDTQKQRKELNKKPDAVRVSQESLVQKFKPLWTKAINSAIVDIKGHVVNQIKNDAFEKAEKKLHHIKNLENAIQNMNQDRYGTVSIIKSSVNVAVMMTAAHYYPEKTGDITKDRNGYSVQNREGVNQLLTDLEQGDTAKLGTVLAFFKRTLISG
jgi:hypothetical protein